MPKQVFLTLPDEVQDKILLAAAEILHEKGIRMATVEDVAKHAEISTEAIGHYFENKTDLIASVIGRAIQYFNQVYIEIGGTTEPFWSRVEHLLQVSALRVRKLGAYLNVYLNIGGSGLPEFAQATFDRFESRAALFFQNLVLAGIQEGVLRDDIDLAMMANHFQEATRIVLSRRAHPLYRARSKAYFPDLPLTDNGDDLLINRLVLYLKSIYGSR